MNGYELFRMIRKLARQRGIRCEIVKHHGKVSHGTLYFGDRRTAIKDRKKEIGKGLLSSMLKDLGLDIDEL